MIDTGYLLEDTPDGPSLVVTGRWTDAAGRLLARGEVDGLVLNAARGFQEGDLEMLEAGWPLRRLSVLDRSLVDLTPLSRLDGLEMLSIEASPAAELDLSPHAELKSIGGPWNLIRRSVAALTNVEDVSTWAFDESDLRAFRDCAALTVLTLKDAPLLESLSGIEALSWLQRLKIAGAARLKDIEPLGDVARLQELELEDCPGIDAIDELRELRELRFLGISDCGDIASLAPLAGLTRLTVLHAWGSTRILDGDLQPLADLRSLREVRMRDRRGYRPAVRSLAAAVF
jgi:internalin A